MTEPPKRPSDDQVLRSRGFKIHARPNTGQATWERHGKVFFHFVALKIAQRELRGIEAQLRQAEQQG